MPHNPDVMYIDTEAYSAAIAHMTTLEVGGHFRLLRHRWEMGSLPSEDWQQRLITGMTHEEWERSRQTILAALAYSATTYVHAEDQPDA